MSSDEASDMSMQQMIEEQLEYVLRQTNLDKEDAIQRLQTHKHDGKKVVEEYFEIGEFDKKQRNENSRKIKACELQREMFTQIRRKLDRSKQEYNEKHKEQLEQTIRSGLHSTSKE